MKLKYFLIIILINTIFNQDSVFDIIEEKKQSDQNINNQIPIPNTNQPILQKLDSSSTSIPNTQTPALPNATQQIPMNPTSSILPNNPTPMPILGPQILNNQNNNSIMPVNNLQAMIDKIKSKVTNPYLKNNFTLDSIANFFANLISGNEFVNNLEVKDLAEFNKLEVKENMKVKNEAFIDNLTVNKFNHKAFSIVDNEIIFDPEASLKLKNTNVSFKFKDIFEVITFMKYIVKICGSTLEKCDFNTLLKNHNTDQLMQIINIVHKKQEKEKLEEDKKKKEEEKKLDDMKKTNTTKIEEEKKTIKKEDYNYNFKEKILPDEDLNGILNDDYTKFLSNPDISQTFNNYYYDFPAYYNNNEFLN